MDIKHIAAILLLGRLVSVFFMAFVVKRQRALLKLPIDPSLAPFRRTLNRLSIAVLIGNVIPIILDASTILSANALEREDTPSTIGVMYAFSNCITSALSAYLIWKLYKQAEKTVLIVDQATEDALNLKSGTIKSDK